MAQRTHELRSQCCTRTAPNHGAQIDSSKGGRTIVASAATPRTKRHGHLAHSLSKQRLGPGPTEAWSAGAEG
eukprot:6996285-Alexandrium_andersonii.AAC.1